MVATNQHSQLKRHHTNAFLFYSHEQLKHNKEGNHRLNKGVMKNIGDRWKLLSQDEKQKFLDMEQMSSSQYFLDKAGLSKKARQRRIQTRTSLGSIVLIVNKLNEQQRQAVTEIGLGGLLGIRCTRLNLELCEFLVHNFNPESCSLDVHDRQFNLTLKDVSDILGVRSNGCDIDVRGSLEGMESLHESVGVANGVIPLDGLRKYLEDEKTVDAGDEFKQKFALYALGALLCPTTKVSLNVSSLHFVKDVQVMKNCNWGNLTLHSLVCGINIYQHQKRVNISGCLFLLLLFYLDNVSPTFESTYATTRSIPRLNDWGDSQLKKTFRVFRKLGGFHNEVKVTFSKPNQMNVHHVDVVKTEIYDDMRHDIGELKHTMISVKKEIMNWEQKANALGDGVETRQQIGELKDVVYNLHNVIMKHIVHPDQLAAANGLHCFNSVEEEMKSDEGVKAANKIGATAKPKIAHNLMSEKNNGEESDGPSIEFVGVKERARKKGRKGQVIKEKEATGTPPAEHSLPIFGSGRGRGRGGAGGPRGRGRGQTKYSLMHATTQSVDMGDTSSCNDDYVAPITRSEEERRPAPCVRSPYFADGVKKVQKVNQVQTTSMLTDDDEDVAVANVGKHMGKFLDNLLGPSNEKIIPQSPLIEKTSPSTFLTSEEEVMVKFIFDENCIQGESVIAMGLHFTDSVEIGTRQYMCCLKPYAWICTTVINLVVIQLTNKQRTKYSDGRHRIWYMSEYASQMIIKNEEYEGNNERVADLFFKNKGYTGPIDACEEIYIPFNHNKDHWLCLKIDMVHHAAYLFDSKPSRRFGEDRKKMGELLLENMHEVLKHAYGLDYVQDLSLFKVDWLSEQPLQMDEDNYDCGLFVIKYMQSAPLLPGFQKFDPIERRRLLVDLLKDVNNRRFLEFRIQFDMYNMRDSRMQAILQGDKASMTGRAAKKCVPFRRRGKK